MKEPVIGQVINGKWRLLSELGQGAMGKVYQAQHEVLGTVRALKMLSLAPKKETLARFEREARVMYKCDNNDNIVKIFDFERDPEYPPYFVMEYVKGKTLEQYIKDNGALSIAEVLKISRQVAKALEWAHARKPAVIHRDIKPSNIMMEELTGRVVVMDFGIAKEIGATDLTQFGLALGTMKYMSREQLRAEQLDGRADIYALGMVMHVAYAGRHPLDGLDDPIAEVCHKPEEFDVSFIPNNAFKEIVRNTIAKSRDQRYKTIGHFLSDLDACQKEVGQTDADKAVTISGSPVIPLDFTANCEKGGGDRDKLSQNDEAAVTVGHEQAHQEGLKKAAQIARQRIQEGGFPEDAAMLKSKAVEKYIQADELLLKAEQHWKAQAYEMAKEHYDLACDAYAQGRAEAKFCLGDQYSEGDGVEKDYKLAAEYYRQAAEQGHPQAQTSLGFLYEKGVGVIHDYAEAIRWYRQAAEQGESYGQTNLGVMYAAGKGVPQDYVEAAKWYRQAAEQGHASAQYSIGLLYEHGWGVTKDGDEAMKWYRLAADQGETNAQRKLQGREREHVN